MIYVGEHEAILCKGDFEPAALYRGSAFIGGAKDTVFEAETISADRTYNAPLSLEQTGKTGQSGIPTPDAPINIQSILAGTSVNVSDINNVIKYSATCEYNLYASDKWNIVSGEYTFDKMIYEVTGNEAWGVWAHGYQVNIGSKNVGVAQVPIFCTHFVGTSTAQSTPNSVTQSYGLIYFNPNQTTYNVTEWKSWAAAQKAAGTPIIIVCQRATPLVVQGTAHSIKSVPRHTNIYSVPTSGGLVPSLKTTMETY